jgi:hypothetical protein
MASIVYHCVGQRNLGDRFVRVLPPTTGRAADGEVEQIVPRGVVTQLGGGAASFWPGPVGCALIADRRQPILAARGDYHARRESDTGPITIATNMFHGFWSHGS